jgi:hypothetical protein
MNLGQRLGSSGGGSDVFEKFQQCRPMPRTAVKGAPKLIGDAGGFGWCANELCFH